MRCVYGRAHKRNQSLRFVCWVARFLRVYARLVRTKSKEFDALYADLTHSTVPTLRDKHKFSGNFNFQGGNFTLGVRKLFFFVAEKLGRISIIT